MKGSGEIYTLNWLYVVHRWLNNWLTRMHVLSRKLTQISCIEIYIYYIVNGKHLTSSFPFFFVYICFFFSSITIKGDELSYIYINQNMQIPRIPFCIR